MKYKNLIIVLFLFPLMHCAQGSKQPKENIEAFKLEDVRLLDGPFNKAMMNDMNYILELDMDRLLAPYLKEGDLEPKADNYTNWENTGLDGHIGGHYLSALSKMYAATGDNIMKERMDYMLSELKRAQDASGNGYLSGVPGGRQMWKDISEGKIDAASFSLNDKWVPLYNIHKIYAGLYDAYIHGGSDEAKEMLIKLTDWAIQLIENLSEEQIQDMLRSEHGGLNEVFADVAAITGDEKYLKLARQFSELFILEPLLEQEDHLTGMHANTQIPKVIGYKRIAELDGNKSWEDAARYFWEEVVTKRSISIGGNSVREHFNPVDDFSSMISSEQGPETCNTYNMLKLTKMLFLTEPLGKYMDYYERALYNHILSTQEPENGGLVYFTPMRPEHYRVYSQPHTSFWCCVGSGLENHTKYGELIYAHSDNDLYVNLFIPSTLNWEEKGLKLTQETNFPDTENTILTIDLEKKDMFTLNIRYPQWVEAGALKVQVNGKNELVNGTPGSYFSIKRTWKKGDKVEITLPMHTEVEQLPDNTNYYSILHGPIVLAAKTDTLNMDGLYADDSRGGHIASGLKYPLQDAPVIIKHSDDITSNIKKIESKPLTFSIDNVYPEKFKNIELIPFFRLHNSRYIIYWQSETKEDLEDMQQTMAVDEAEKQMLDAATIDIVYPGEQQPESDHFIESENSQTGIHNGRHWRDARGWFSYQMIDEKNNASFIRVMYFGLDNNRRFNILVNNKPI
ncbi:MAG: glycosyl hydrolase, partial [Bacteroidales bacterium]|nr:glycosyl hydrolase [Bacteroidales bacterium]